MVIYKETVRKIALQKKTTLSELSRNLGYNRNYLAIAFGKKDSHNFPYAIIAGICTILKCTEEELGEVPTKTAIVPVSTGPTQIIHGVDPEIIKESFRMIHADLQELIKLWKPAQEPIKIGGEYSK